MANLQKRISTGKTDFAAEQSRGETANADLANHIAETEGFVEVLGKAITALSTLQLPAGSASAREGLEATSRVRSTLTLLASNPILSAGLRVNIHSVLDDSDTVTALLQGQPARWNC